MNNYFNFTIPSFSQKYGVDWSNFQAIVDAEVDNLFERTYALYYLNDIDYMTVRVAEKVLDALKITYSVTETLKSKKYKLRTFITNFARKGLADLYLDIQENIVGTRGVIYTGSLVGWRWNFSRWSSSSDVANEAMRWNNISARFNIYIDVKTTDSNLLDAIVAAYRERYMLPAFYRIQLIDSGFAILRTV